MNNYLPSLTNIKTVSDLRDNPVALLHYVSKTKNPLYILHRSRPMAALIDLHTLAEILDLHHATQDLNQTIKLSDKKFIEFDKLDKQLRNKHGLPNPHRKTS